MELEAKIGRFDRALLETHQLVTLDFEFTRLPFEGESWSDWLSQVIILSIGMAGGGPPTVRFYAKVRWRWGLRKACDPWTAENVLPAMKEAKHAFLWDEEADIPARLLEVLDFYTRRGGKPIALVSNWGGDLLLIHKLLGEASPLLLLAEFPVDQVFAGSQEESWEGLVRHNALHDAIQLERLLRVGEMLDTEKGRHMAAPFAAFP